MTKYLVFTLWITLTVGYSQLKHLRSGKVANFYCGDRYQSASQKRPPDPLHQLPHIVNFWENGSKFSNSVESMWKYIKFATFHVQTEKIRKFDLGPPPVPLSYVFSKSARFHVCREIYRKSHSKKKGSKTSIFRFLSHLMVQWPCWPSDVKFYIAD